MKRYDMKLVPEHLRPVVEILILGGDIFIGDYDTEENLTELAGKIVAKVRELDIPDDYTPLTKEYIYTDPDTGICHVK